MRRMEMINFDVLVVVSASPVFGPTVKPENVMAPAEPSLVTRMSTAQSEVGAVHVAAP